ncbi:MAG TPA: 4'-phosphopantetheinyl transferase superfamily protein [Pyrinomonadaceae bacterium]|nr:4'-phosphopantetheinyl transferase superfamily protein [Pyrinomonadaceae bacterium]
MNTTRNVWSPGPARPSIEADEVHVWRVALEQPPATRSALHETLSADESERAARFHFERDRRSYICARGALRSILARYLGRAAREIEFTYNPYGKPSLAGESGPDELRFNLSHAAGVALCAVARGREVGIDVELTRGELATMDVAERFFSRTEVEALRAHAGDERAAAFFNCWTRKEAYIKARGEGLSHPLHTFAVSIAEGAPARLLSTDNDPAEAARWTLRELPLEGAYVAALACEGSLGRLSLWSWKV